MFWTWPLLLLLMLLLPSAACSSDLFRDDVACQVITYTAQLPKSTPPQLNKTVASNVNGSKTTTRKDRRIIYLNFPSPSSFINGYFYCFIEEIIYVEHKTAC